MSQDGPIYVNCKSQIPPSASICPFCRMDPRIVGSPPLAFGGGNSGPSDSGPAGCFEVVIGLVIVIAVFWFIAKVMSHGQ